MFRINSIISKKNQTKARLPMVEVKVPEEIVEAIGKMSGKRWYEVNAENVEEFAAAVEEVKGVFESRKVGEELVRECILSVYDEEHGSNWLEQLAVLDGFELRIAADEDGWYFSDAGTIRLGIKENAKSAGYYEEYMKALKALWNKVYEQGVMINGEKYKPIFATNSQSKKGHGYLVKAEYERAFRGTFARELLVESSPVNVSEVGVDRYNQTVANLLTPAKRSGIKVGNAEVVIVREPETIREVRNGAAFTQDGVEILGVKARTLCATDGACYINTDVYAGEAVPFQARAMAVHGSGAVPFKAMVGFTKFSAAQGEYITDVWKVDHKLSEVMMIMTCNTIKVNPAKYASAEEFWSAFGGEWELMVMSEDEDVEKQRSLSTQAMMSLGQLPERMWGPVVEELAEKSKKELEKELELRVNKRPVYMSAAMAVAEAKYQINGQMKKLYEVLNGKPILANSGYSFILPDPVYFIEQLSYYADGTRVAETCYYTKDDLGLVHVANKGTECITGRAARGGMLGVLAAHEKVCRANGLKAGEEVSILRFPHANFEWTTATVTNEHEEIMPGTVMYFGCHDDDISILQGDFDGDHAMWIVNEALSNLVNKAWEHAEEFDIHTLIYGHEEPLKNPKIKGASDFSKALSDFSFRSAMSSNIGKYARVVEYFNYMASASPTDEGKKLYRRLAEFSTFMENKSLDASKKSFVKNPYYLVGMVNRYKAAYENARSAGVHVALTEKEVDEASAIINEYFNEGNAPYPRNRIYEHELALKYNDDTRLYDRVNPLRHNNQKIVAAAMKCLEHTPVDKFFSVITGCPIGTIGLLPEDYEVAMNMEGIDHDKLSCADMHGLKVPTVDDIKRFTWTSMFGTKSIMSTCDVKLMTNRRILGYLENNCFSKEAEWLMRNRYVYLRPCKDLVNDFMNYLMELREVYDDESIRKLFKDMCKENCFEFAGEYSGDWEKMWLYIMAVQMYDNKDNLSVEKCEVLGLLAGEEMFNLVDALVSDEVANR